MAFGGQERMGMEGNWESSPAGKEKHFHQQVERWFSLWCRVVYYFKAFSLCWSEEKLLVVVNFNCISRILTGLELMIIYEEHGGLPERKEK